MTDHADYRRALVDQYQPVTKAARWLQTHALQCPHPDYVAERLCEYAIEVDTLTRERDEARATLDAERRRGIRMAAVLTKVADACIEDDAQVFFDRLDEALGLCSGSTWWQTADALRELVGGSHD